MEKRKLPPIGLRTLKTVASATLIAIIYSFFDRSACFACIGAVFGMGNRFRGGLQAGGNRFIGTLIGGLVSLPFYLLYHEYSEIVPQWLYLSLGLLLLMYICQLTRAYGGVQPGAVVFFVVIYTVADPAHFSYVFARILDTGIGVAFSCLISWIFPSPLDARERQLRELEDNGRRLLLLERDLDAMKDYQAHLHSELEKLEPLIEQIEREVNAPLPAVGTISTDAAPVSAEGTVSACAAPLSEERDKAEGV